MIKVLMFFTLPSGNQWKLETVAKLPLSEFVNIFSNKPHFVYGLSEGVEYYWFGEGWTTGAASLLLKEVYK